MEKGSKKHLIVLIIAIALFGIILFPLFDFLLCTFITHSKFVYSIHEHITEPVMFAVVIGIVFWLTDKRKS